MSVDALINRPCVIVGRSAGEDGWGNPTETNTETSGLCEIQQLAAEESGLPGNWGEATHRVFLKRSVTLTRIDAVKVDGETYEIQGPPTRIRNPRTRRFSHIEARAKRVA